MIPSYQEMIDRATACADSHNRQWLNYRFERMRNDLKSSRRALVLRYAEKRYREEADTAIGLSPNGYPFGPDSHCTYSGCLILHGSRKNPIARVRFYFNRRGYVHAFKILVLGKRERFYRIGIDSYIKTEDSLTRSYKDSLTRLYKDGAVFK